MRLLDSLVEAAALAIPEDRRGEFVIFGSAPMVFAGLKSDVKNDLDLFVADYTFDRLVAAGCQVDVQNRDVPRIVLAQDVEVFKTWLGVTFDEVYVGSAPHVGSRGLRVASLAHVLAFKLASNRDKDQADVALLRNALPR